ncbi:MAG: hypothetical protein K1X28_05565 [Parachlamydiales bacterium]|nr:hypothetical protein [Parachlamydiales bacterium]
MSTYTDTWSKDYAKLFGDDGTGNTNGDIWVSTQEQTGLSDAVSNYHSEMDRIGHTSDAMIAFVLLALLLANQGMQQMNYQSALDAGALKIQGDITTLNNDLEDLTNQTDDATATQNTDGSYSYTYQHNYLDLVAQRAELMHQKLDEGGTGCNADLTKILGDNASNSLSENFLTIRGQIYDTNVSDNSPKGETVYFTAMTQNTNPAGDPYVESYCEFQIDLETRGDPKGVNEGMKAKTDAFNLNTSTTQSTNAASQEVISNDQKKTQSVQAFIVAMFHAMMDVISASVKAVGKGG